MACIWKDAVIKCQVLNPVDGILRSMKKIIFGGGGGFYPNTGVLWRCSAVWYCAFRMWNSALSTKIFVALLMFFMRYKILHLY
jgi:hypothetical protein